MTMLLALLVGCIQTSSEPEIVATRIVEAPRPPATFDLQAGAATYAQWCVQCHGEQGRGDGPTAAAFSCPLPNFPERPANIILSDWFNTVQNGNGSSDTSCLMPPWNQRLNTEQMWDVSAYITSLVYDAELAATGQVLLESKTTTDTPFDFTNPRWQVDSSDAIILATMNGNQFEGYNLEGLTDEEKQAVLVYIRSLNYAAFPVEIAAAQPDSTPQPNTTEEPSDAVELAITPLPLGTPEVSDETSTSETFTITGQVTHGTAGATVPADLTLTLRVVALNAEGAPEEVLNTQTTVSADGSYTFADVPRVERALASVETDYAGIRQFAPQFSPASVTTDTFELAFPIYETTTDSSVVEISYMELLIDAVTAEQASLTYQTFEIANTSDKVLIAGESGRTLEFPLPADILSPQAEAVGNFEGRFEITETDSGYVVYDTAPLFPGGTRIGFSYGKNYDGEMNLTVQNLYATQEVNVFVSATRGLEVESDQLSATENLEFNGISYAGYALADAQSLPANTPLTIRVFDGPNANRPETAANTSSSTDEEEQTFLQENVTLILGIGILLIVAGGMFMFYDLQKTRLVAARQGTPTRTSKKDLIAEIAELDAAFEAGEIDEKTYQRERDSLKAALRRFIE